MRGAQCAEEDFLCVVVVAAVEGVPAGLGGCVGCVGCDGGKAASAGLGVGAVLEQMQKHPQVGSRGVGEAPAAAGGGSVAEYVGGFLEGVNQVVGD
ncbi:hypothetical protein [Streptomyces axinellae]|uniref:Uncharacterized protein n=1 Tax=Streptomyces axinellae TaxID=552788 RepID=A0ABP6C561_9ACTN